MSATEMIIVALATGAAVLYLVRRAWLRFAAGRAGCCGKCPVAGPKIRLAERPDPESIEAR
jgi:hypothetical protein